MPVSVVDNLCFVGYGEPFRRQVIFDIENELPQAVTLERSRSGTMCTKKPGGMEWFEIPTDVREEVRKAWSTFQRDFTRATGKRASCAESCNSISIVQSLKLFVSQFRLNRHH